MFWRLAVDWGLLLVSWYSVWDFISCKTEISLDETTLLNWFRRGNMPIAPLFESLSLFAFTISGGALATGLILIASLAMKLPKLAVDFFDGMRVLWWNEFSCFAFSSTGVC